MKLIALIAAAALTLAAQTPPDAAPAQTSTASAPAPAAESSVPQPGGWLTGWVETGYRWNMGIGGSLETFRSIVNLGSGPKLLGTGFTITDPHHRWFDAIHVEAYDWSDPYSTFRMDAERKGWYRFTASYRSLAYFNNLPSYADPLLMQGIMLDEQSFDARRHIGSVEVHALPQRMISPFLAWDHDHEDGHGVTTFQASDNEFPVPYTTINTTNLFRGGVNATLPRLHLMLEVGGTNFRSNENSYETGTNTGNSTSLVLGQPLDLNALLQAEGVRGTSEFSRAVLAADPFSWLDVYGHFGYSDPHNDVNYTQYDTGNLILLSQVLFYSGEQFLETAAARMPHTNGDLGWEIKPLKRLHIEQHWLTDRQHNSGSTAGSDKLLSAGSTTILPEIFDSFLASNYNEVESGLTWEPWDTVHLRGSYRYEWGDANDLVLPQTGLLTVENSRLRRNVVLGGASWRPTKSLLASADFEWGMSGSEYFRTSLYNYRKARINARYDLTSTLHLSADYRILGNKNPLAGTPYKSLSHQESASLQWMPTGSKVDFIGTYEHCGFDTRMTYLDPGFLITDIADYREYCHDVSATANATLPGFLKKARLSIGGSALLTSGSRPTTYYQPLVKLAVPLARGLGWFATWQYYGFGDAYYSYESFQSNLFTTGLRYSR
ncbi:MAG TPA: hypothetical protein VEF06_07060 [Bryobacteraceae bacterium]|nr:hypothetical protein [Bryobacteraceae bacterium]